MQLSLKVGGTVNVLIACTSLLIQISAALSVKCPCANEKWCEPVWNITRKEVFAFSINNNADHWEKFDWNKITTVVQTGYVNPQLVCLAHSNKARVVRIGNIDASTILDPKLRAAWIENQLKITQDNFMDGLNFDFENEVLKNQTDIRDAYTKTVNETVKAFKAVNPHYQISVDVAWKPNIDSRYYDYKGLGQVADLLFVMLYDEQSQIYGECLAMPNSGLHRAQEGLEEYLTNPLYKADPKKLVLGVPWYGYIYPCVNLSGDKCSIKKVPFRGVNCSDAAGREYDYGFIKTLLKTMQTSPQWNATSSTPYATFKEGWSGVPYQIQYDDPKSLSLKYALAAKYGLWGVGMWNIDALDYSDTEEGEDIRKEMFGALP